MTGDVGEMFNEMKADRRAKRDKYGVPCPECVAKLPRACPSILLPQQRCKIHGYRDQRPRLPEEPKQ